MKERGKAWSEMDIGRMGRKGKRGRNKENEIAKAKGMRETVFSFLPRSFPTLRFSRDCQAWKFAANASTIERERSGI